VMVARDSKERKVDLTGLVPKRAAATSEPLVFSREFYSVKCSIAHQRINALIFENHATLSSLYKILFFFLILADI